MIKMIKPDLDFDFSLVVIVIRTIDYFNFKNKTFIAEK
jgi:hypothetical protein